MKKMLLLLVCGLVAAAPLWARWRSLGSDAVLLFYPEGYEARAEALLAALEENRGQLEALLGNRVRRPVLVLEDFGSLANGYADPVFMSIHLGLSPPAGGALSGGRSWYALVGVHEYAHLVQLTARGGFPGLLATLFGNYLNPNLFVPLWWVEGVAVYSESEIDAYSGRLNGGVYDAWLAARVREESFPTLAEATFQPAAFPGGEAPYLFGGQFVHYLAETYGRDNLALFIAETGSSTLAYFSPLLPALGMDRGARRVFGRSFRRLWEDWRRYEEVRLAPHVQEGERVSSDGWDTDRPVVAGGRLYYSRGTPVKSGPFRSRRSYALVEYSPATGKETVLVRSTAPFACPFRVAGDTLYYALAELEAGYGNTWLDGYGYSARLYALDMASGQRRLLARGSMRAFAVSNQGEIFISRDRAQDFGSELWLLADGRAPERLAESDYLVGEMLAKDEEIFVTARREGETFNIYALNRRAVRAAATGGRGLESLARPLLKSEFREFGLSVSGDRLLFTANYAGRLDCYALDTVSGTLYRLPGGTAGAAALDGDSLYFVGAGSAGTAIYRRPARLAAEPPQPFLPQDTAAAPRPATYQPADYRRGGYAANLGTLLPRVLVPLVSAWIDCSGIDVTGAGGAVMGRSALGDIAYTLQGVYAPARAEIDLDLDVSILLLAPLRLSLAFSTAAENELEAALETPVYRSLQTGLSSVYLGLASRLQEEDFSRHQLVPFAGAGWQSPRALASARLESVLERRSLGSARDQSGLLGRLGLSRQLGSAEVSARLLGAWAFEDAAWKLPAPRGYTEGTDAARGGLLALDFSLPPIKIRRGLWNPSVYVEDLFFVPFFDLAFSAAGVGQYAGGMEIHLEVKLLSMLGGLPLDAYAGAALNRNRELSAYFGIESPLLPLRVDDTAAPPTLPAAGAATLQRGTQ
jgi:hypothetical protein